MLDNISLEKPNTSKILKDWDSEKSDLPRSGFWWGCEEEASGTDPVFPEGASKSLGESWPCKLIWASLMWPDIWKCESKTWNHGTIWAVGQTCGFLTCCVTALLSLTPLSHLWTIIVLCSSGNEGMEQKQGVVRSAKKINPLLTVNGTKCVWIRRNCGLLVLLSITAKDVLSCPQSKAIRAYRS